MTETELLDAVTEILRATEQPEIAEVDRFDGGEHSPAGIRVTFKDKSRTYMQVFSPEGRHS